jgi:hypothetical protein
MANSRSTNDEIGLAEAATLPSFCFGDTFIVDSTEAGRDGDVDDEISDI